jgi:dolichol-phosphate mannosyltransferase
VSGDLKVGLVIPAYNEAENLRRLLKAIPQVVEVTVVVNDASTDETSQAARDAGVELIERKKRGGPGPAIRDGLRLLRKQGLDVAVTMAANGKHDPAQIPDLVRPIVEENLDLVRGSRFMAGGAHQNMPWHRLYLIKLFTLLFSLLVARRVTDATGGFQAYRLRILDDPAIDLDQRWLQRYELETYLFAKTLMRGYRWTEVPVTITYPGRGRTYTRARAVVDWWAYFRPVLLLRLHLRH